MRERLAPLDGYEYSCQRPRMGNLGASELFLLFPVLFWIVGSIPAYVVGKRRGLRHAGEAFIPIVGPTIVILRSINRSGWMCIIGLIPLVSLVFDIWLVCVVPGDHGRSRWWILPFLIPVVNWVAFFIYAFTLPVRRSGEVAWAVGS